jgi:uncharacterized membrane protein
MANRMHTVNGEGGAMDSVRDRPFSSEDALRFGWTTTKANLKPLLLLGLVGAFLWLLNQALSDGPGDGLRALLLLCVQVAQVALAMVWIRVALTLHDGQRLEWTRPPGFLGDFFTFLLTWVLYGLVVGVGLLLLIVPGVIWGLKFGFAGFLVVDKKRDPLEAFRESNRLTAGVKGQLFVFALLLLGVNLLGALALGVGLFVTVPMTYLAAAYVFRRLQARAAQRVQPTPQIPLGTPSPTGAA